jgi:hypothetical protein
LSLPTQVKLNCLTACLAAAIACPLRNYGAAPHNAEHKPIAA